VESPPTRFHDKCLCIDSRRAVVRIRRNLYSAKLVDLPTIIESSKTLDKKSLYKTADICQMLLIGDQIPHEETILAYPSRPSDYIYPHGLTPPLRWVRKRRFRKRISNRVHLFKLIEVMLIPRQSNKLKANSMNFSKQILKP